MRSVRVRTSLAVSRLGARGCALDKVACRAAFDGRARLGEGAELAGERVGECRRILGGGVLGDAHTPQRARRDRLERARDYLKSGGHSTASAVLRAERPQSWPIALHSAAAA